MQHSDLYDVEPVADRPGWHTHPRIQQKDVNLARRLVTYRTRTNAIGEPVRISYNVRLRCCGLMLSTITPGEQYPDAGTEQAATPTPPAPEPEPETEGASRAW